MAGETLRIPQPPPGGLSAAGISEGFAHRMMYSVAKDEFTATPFNMYQALAFTLRDRLMERWFATQTSYYRADVKRVYYLSLEFLLGRMLSQAALSLRAGAACAEAMTQMGCRLEALEEQEWDAGLGNGGLGRLAACILDSAATLGLPVYGYGIRYDFGIFRQHIQDGFQVEAPDNWLRYGNPWEIPRPDLLFPVRFYGRTRHTRDDGGYRVEWIDTEDVWALAYDTPVPGFGNGTVNTLRLWSARASREFDLARFNAGEYVRAVEEKTLSENITKVLYPPDDQYAGKELRLKQQYFFVSATLQDVLRRFQKRAGRRWEDLPDKVAIQLNDTHPALAIPELMRILVDQQGLEWERAWSLTQAVFAYTNHTVLPEALERWPAALLGRLLPRHLEIVEEIDRRFRESVRVAAPGDEETLRRVAILDQAANVRMAHLAFVGSHSVNGVAQLHTQILERSTFRELHALFPGRLTNKTNGITPRRWLLQCNPGLARLVNEAIGEGWVRDLAELEGLRPLAKDAAFRARWRAVKRANKLALSSFLLASHGLASDPDALFDCQVKRIHEYKRQLLNVLHAIALFHRLRDGEPGEAPRVILFAGKAAPGYAMAKLIIKLIHAVGAMIDAEPLVRGRLRVVFVPDYSVSVAERVFPAVDLSEQISTAGTEASGTGNMKSTLNGGAIIGTLDGANIEIKDAVGEENIFVFGHKAEEIDALRSGGYRAEACIAESAELARAIEAIAAGALEQANPGLFAPIVRALSIDDRYFHCADFASYAACQRRAAACWARPDDWAEVSILNVAGMGRFSSDRTVREYATQIWGIG